jgi:hypothetical protein
MPRNSTAPVAISKPSKPYPEFPRFPHATRRWAKKVRGKLHYFESWDDDPVVALARYLDQKDAIKLTSTPYCRATKREKQGFP